MTEISRELIKLIMCHLVGDYVLQCDFIAQTKGSNWYHLFVHCALYVLPLMVCYGVDWRLAFIFVTHIIIDALKARYKKITYVEDQLFHYTLLTIYLVG